MAFTSVNGKVAIVTGAGSGIDLAFAKLLLSEGCSVLFADLELRPEAQDVVNAYAPEAHKNAKAIFKRTDVKIWTELEDMFKVCEKELGPADIVCPGAGVYEPSWSNFWIPPGTAPSADLPDGNRYASFDILITHPVRTTQLAISHFLRHKRPGSIVHISSIAAQGSGILSILYRSSKAAISAFVRSMARLETPDNLSLPKIRVTAVAPGVIKTPLWLEQPDKLKWVDEAKDVWVTPEEVAKVMLDLILKEQYVGGTILEVTKDRTRKVELWNDPGPGEVAGATVHPGGGKEEVWDKLASGSWGQTYTY